MEVAWLGLAVIFLLIFRWDGDEKGAGADSDGGRATIKYQRPTLQDKLYKEL